MKEKKKRKNSIFFITSEKKLEKKENSLVKLLASGIERYLKCPIHIYFNRFYAKIYGTPPMASTINATLKPYLSTQVFQVSREVLSELRF